MDEDDWDEKCPKCGESMFVTYMETWGGERFGYGVRQCACQRYDEQEEMLRV